MEIEKDTLKNIENVLGRSLSDNERGNVNNFWSFTDSDLLEISSLGKKSLVWAVSYIMFRLKNGASLRASKSYYTSVVDEGIPVHEWVEESAYDPAEFGIPD